VVGALLPSILPAHVALGDAVAKGGQRLSGSARRLPVEHEVVCRIERLARNQVSQEAPGEDRDGHSVTRVTACEEDVVCGPEGTDRRQQVERHAHVSSPSVRDRNVGKCREQAPENARKAPVVPMPLLVRGDTTIVVKPVTATQKDSIVGRETEQVEVASHVVKGLAPAPGERRDLGFRPVRARSRAAYARRLSCPP